MMYALLIVGIGNSWPLIASVSETCCCCERRRADLDSTGDCFFGIAVIAGATCPNGCIGDVYGPHSSEQCSGAYGWASDLYTCYPNHGTQWIQSHEYSYILGSYAWHKEPLEVCIKEPSTPAEECCCDGRIWSDGWGENYLGEILVNATFRNVQALSQAPSTVE